MAFAAFYNLFYSPTYIERLVEALQAHIDGVKPISEEMFPHLTRLSSFVRGTSRMSSTDIEMRFDIDTAGMLDTLARINLCEAELLRFVEHIHQRAADEIDGNSTFHIRDLMTTNPPARSRVMVNDFPFSYRSHHVTTSYVIAVLVDSYARPLVAVYDANTDTVRDIRGWGCQAEADAYRLGLEIAFSLDTAVESCFKPSGDVNSPVAVKP